MSLRSLTATGTKVWLDSVDPAEVAHNAQRGVTGATSNPIIIADIIKAGGMDDHLRKLIDSGLDDAAIAWQLNDRLVSQAQKVFLPVWEKTGDNDGYVSFEVDPLLEDPAAGYPHARRVEQYIALGRRWSAGYNNRMIKVPATAAGLQALEELAAAGVALNVTLIFSQRQYMLARDAIWRGAQRRRTHDGFKSVYSIFVSRVDVYTDKHVPQLSPAAQGMVGIVNAKRLWLLNQEFWRDKKTPLQQEIIFASTGTKKPTDPPDKYVEALAGGDIQTNPPATNDAVESLGKTYHPRLGELPPQSVLDEIDREVDVQEMEDTLMAEGITKFAEPQKALQALIGQKRRELVTAK